MTFNQAAEKKKEIGAFIIKDGDTLNTLVTPELKEDMYSYLDNYAMRSTMFEEDKSIMYSTNSKFVVIGILIEDKKIRRLEYL